MSQLVRLEGKHSTQNAHCALVVALPAEIVVIIIITIVVTLSIIC